ncbi:unnamed protein product [Tenebrio molitor]|nr:unnamed protein product [Tenebrio molitor]
MPAKSYYYYSQDYCKRIGSNLQNRHAFLATSLERDPFRTRN